LLKHQGKNVVDLAQESSGCLACLVGVSLSVSTLAYNVYGK
jgi:hypothetical protein